jgi:hypothetical protein
MRKENFAAGQRVRLKWELEPPVSIPAAQGRSGAFISSSFPYDVEQRYLPLSRRTTVNSQNCHQADETMHAVLRQPVSV